jgi:hypothetical protein
MVTYDGNFKYCGFPHFKGLYLVCVQQLDSQTHKLKA